MHNDLPKLQSSIASLLASPVIGQDKPAIKADPEILAKMIYKIAFSYRSSGLSTHELSWIGFSALFSACAEHQEAEDDVVFYHRAMCHIRKEVSREAEREYRHEKRKGRVNDQEDKEEKIFSLLPQSTPNPEQAIIREDLKAKWSHFLESLVIPEDLKQHAWAFALIYQGYSSIRAGKVLGVSHMTVFRWATSFEAWFLKKAREYFGV